MLNSCCYRENEKSSDFWKNNFIVTKVMKIPDWNKETLNGQGKMYYNVYIKNVDQRKKVF